MAVPGLIRAMGKHPGVYLAELSMGILRLLSPSNLVCLASIPRLPIATSERLAGVRRSLPQLMLFW